VNRGESILRLSQKPQTRPSFRSRATPANRTRTMNAILDFVGTCSNGPNSPTSETHAS
jgi:hypothetical protein